MLNGIDVSKHNETIDWQKVKSSGAVDFAILRAGYGRLISQKDIQFERNYAECKKYGIPVGCYWYSYAKSVSEIQTEAKVFLDVIRGKQFEYPVYLDFEEKSQFNLGEAKCCEMAKAFLDILEKAGYYAGIYCSSSYLNSFFKETVDGRYTVWCAHYGVSQPSYTGQYDIWQYTAKGKVSGITGGSGYVDRNYCYKENFPDIIKSAGLNGFLKTVENPVENPVETVEKSKRRIEIFIDGERKYSGLLDD
ncbi:MAG: glycoside hydrolase family 25 protein [Oscillospiraceae bacterium]|nr:glycoside hydrolase family 25 protein [Oscillospiraceae bacterium]